jgi:hypothetical protein
MIQIGDFDIAKSAVNTEIRLLALERIVNLILNANPNIITQTQITKIEQESFETIQKRYPQLGLTKS